MAGQPGLAEGEPGRELVPAIPMWTALCLYQRDTRDKPAYDDSNYAEHALVKRSPHRKKYPRPRPRRDAPADGESDQWRAPAPLLFETARGTPEFSSRSTPLHDLRACGTPGAKLARSLVR
jgi:hypothetical protein